MLSGYVLAFRPGTREGTIVTDQGESVRFTARGVGVNLQGGDIVALAEAPCSERTGIVDADDIRLLQKGTAWLASQERPLLQDLYTTLRIHETPT
jgi:hypothetical protein